MTNTALVYIQTMEKVLSTIRKCFFADTGQYLKYMCILMKGFIFAWLIGAGVSKTDSSALKRHSSTNVLNFGSIKKNVPRQKATVTIRTIHTVRRSMIQI